MAAITNCSDFGAQKNKVSHCFPIYLHICCESAALNMSVSKFGKLSSGHRTGKGQFSFQSQRKVMPKECSYYRTIVLISHATKVMLKIPQVRLQQYVNRKLPDVQAGFRKHRGTRDQIANICWIIKKQENFRKKHLLLLHWRRKWQPTPVVLPGKSHGRRILVGYNPWGHRELDMTERLYLLYFTFCFIDHARAINCVNHNKMENSERDGNTRPPDLPLEKLICRSGSKLELDMEQQTGFK